MEIILVDISVADQGADRRNARSLEFFLNGFRQGFSKSSMPPPVHSRMVVIKSDESCGKERFTITEITNSTTKYSAENMSVVKKYMPQILFTLKCLLFSYIPRRGRQ